MGSPKYGWFFNREGRTKGPVLVLIFIISWIEKKPNIAVVVPLKVRQKTTANAQEMRLCPSISVLNRETVEEQNRTSSGCCCGRLGRESREPGEHTSDGMCSCHANLRTVVWRKISSMGGRTGDIPAAPLERQYLPHKLTSNVKRNSQAQTHLKYTIFEYNVPIHGPFLCPNFPLNRRFI